MYTGESPQWKALSNWEIQRLFCYVSLYGNRSLASRNYFGYGKSSCMRIAEISPIIPPEHSEHRLPLEIER